MIERLGEAQRLFPNLKLSLYKLRKIYHQFKIKKKALRFTKIVNAEKKLEYAELALHMSR